MGYLYSWSGYSYPVSADIVGKQCEKIEKEQGIVTRENLLDSARDEKSPIHDLYEWNDEIAGERWRLHQSSVILSSLKVTITESEKESITTRAFINVNEDKDAARYMNITLAMARQQTRSAVLLRALRELESFKAKYGTLSELSAVFSAIDGVAGEMA